MLYLIRLFITTNDSSSWMVSWWTVVLAVSVIPPTSKEKRSSSRTEQNLSTANGQRLRTLGRLNARFIFLGKPCSHDMVVADVVHPILGMDFFQDGEGKRCIIDPRRRCLADCYTMEEFPVDNKTSLVFFADLCNSCDKSLSLRIQGTE